MTISRREFLGLSSLLVTACSSRAAQRDAAVALRAPTPTIADDDEPAPPPPPPPPASPRCGSRTASNIEGPFYKPGAPHRVVLASERDRGERLVLSGRVMTTACATLAKAELDFWHADARGAYDLVGFAFRGALVTDAQGRYELHTIVPGRYENGDTYRPSHIHVKVRAHGHRVLTTQLYFADDPYNDSDPFIVDSLILADRRVGGVRRATFDFVL